MPYNKDKFQSKSHSGGQKFGNSENRGPRPQGREFSKRSEGDRGGRTERGGSFDRPNRAPSDRPNRGTGDRPYQKREQGDRPNRDFSDRPKRDFGDRPQRSYSDKPSFGDRPKRDFGDKPKGNFSDKPKRDFGDRPQRSFDDRPKRDFSDKPKRDFGDRPQRSFDDRPKRDFSDKPKRDFGDRPQRSFDDRPKRDFSDKPKRDFGDRPKRSFDDRPQRSFDDRPKRSFDDRPKRDFSDRPKRDFSDRPPRESSFETRNKLKSERQTYGVPSSNYLFGIHAVSQALLNPKRILQRLLVTQKGYESIQETCDIAAANGITMPVITYVEKEDIDRLLPRDAVHQDILLDCQPLTDLYLDDVLANAPENAKILMLDQVTDPHNVGAIMRSAAAFGAIAVIAQKLHTPDITGTVAKSASGAVEHVPLVREVNLSRALEQLKQAGFFCIGLDEDGKRSLAELKMTGKVVIVLGAEGDGLRRLVADNCDELAKLPTQGAIGSLNVSNAAAIALYELSR